MIVRLLNVGDTTFTNKYGGTKYRIEPGKELYVDVAAAILWMGDPDVRNIDARNRNRADELTRLCVKYGCIGSPLQLRELGPQLEWYLQDGTRVTTIAEDPFGEKTLGTQLTESGAPSTDADSGSTAQKQISKLVDLLDGSIYKLPEDMIINEGDLTLKISHLPIADHPMLLAFGDFCE